MAAVPPLSLRDVATFVTIAGGLATLVYLDHKRRGQVGESCRMADDCQDGTRCIKGECVPFNSSAQG